MANPVNFTGAAETSHNANYATLLAFSLGKLDCAAALQALGIDSDEDLFLLMAQARLPMPRLPDAQTAEMVVALHTLLRFQTSNSKTR